jgi:hypothetical protein
LSPDPDALAVAWRPRTVPLAPLGLIAAGASSRALVERLLRKDDDALGRLRGVAGSDIVAVVGPEAELPWADGVVYLGRDDGAPALLLPTHLEPLVALPLLEAALLRRIANPAPPLAVLPAPPTIVPTGGARPIERALLRAWLEARR